MRLPAKWKYPQLRDGLVGAWSASQGATGDKLFDRSDYNNHGTLTNMEPDTDWIVSGSGLSLNLDGSNERIIISSSIIQSLSLTYSIWCNLSNTTASNTLMGLGRTNTSRNNIYLEVNSGISNAYKFVNGGFSSLVGTGFPVANNTWTHIAMTVVGTACVLYVDGNAIAGTLSGAFPSSPDQFALGAFIDSNGAYLNHAGGSLDDALVYNHALTLNEIRLLAQCRGRAYETMPTRYRMSGSGGGPPVTFKGRNMLVGCAF